MPNQTMAGLSKNVKFISDLSTQKTVAAKVISKLKPITELKIFWTLGPKQFVVSFVKKQDE